MVKRKGQVGNFTEGIGSCQCPLGLIGLSEDADPSPARNLILAWLRAKRDAEALPVQAMASAERECGSDEELCSVLYVEAMILFYSTEVPAAIDKATRCLSLSSRTRNRDLEAHALLQLGRIYEALGHGVLGAEYVHAAAKIMADRLRLPEAQQPAG